MNNVQEIWNEKFSNEEYLYGKSPNQYIKEKSKLIEINSDILCLGEGEGRNALYLSDIGHSITSIDASSSAVDKLNKLLSAHGHSINAYTQNLEDWEPNEEKFAGITTSYLHLPKPLLKKVINNSIKALKNNGIFIGEFFSKKQINYKSGGPKSIDMLYEIKDFKDNIDKENIEIIELKEEIVYLDEGQGHQGEASVIRVVFKKLILPIISV